MGSPLAAFMGASEPEAKEPEEKSPKESGELLVLAEECIEAFRDGKASKLASALKAFHYAVDAEMGEEASEE
jgi:hypothetical protein